jgi:hypothetical protein
MAYRIESFVGVFARYQRIGPSAFHCAHETSFLEKYLILYYSPFHASLQGGGILFQHSVALDQREAPRKKRRISAELDSRKVMRVDIEKSIR